MYSVYFPSFSEGLSLREAADNWREFFRQRFPFLFGGTFIEGVSAKPATRLYDGISLPFRRDFH